ncbi:MAG TPA: hypothetical protein VKR60_04255 [Candidatus Sulfotelmatobacter sp.]|nr:hypothetical protein [Candidatus Sulfotelmatobacter sp.]
MKEVYRLAAVAVAMIVALLLPAQEARPAAQTASAASKLASSAASAAAADPGGGKQYSGTYTFLKEGEYVQITVEDAGQVTGFISRFGDSGNEKSTFVDQFFKTGKLDGNKLSFTTKPVHAVWFEFNGAFERGEGKTPEEEAYYVLKGTLTENTTSPDKKVTSQAQEVAFRLFPQEAEAPAAKN